MINTKDIDISKLNVTIRLIIEEAVRRGWQVKLPYSLSATAFIDRGYGETLRIYSATPPTVSYVAAYIANDKLATHSLLELNGFPVMKTIMTDSIDTNKAQIDALLAENSVVVKPLDSGHGKGITTNITNKAVLKDAISYAQEYTKSADLVLVQAMYKNPIDIRVLCIDKKVAAATIRRPAAVMGDGVSTVKELINKENKEKRGIAYRTKLGFIDSERAQQFLQDKMIIVPGANERYEVIGTANVGAGGESIDCTNDIPAWLAKLACDIADTMNLPVCGVDFMVMQNPTTQSTKEQLRPMVTEVNKCPSFGLHHYPSYGDAQNVAKLYCDYLEKL